MGDLSDHFSRSEFTERDTPAPFDVPEELVWRLEALRRRIGRPLPLLSWYRDAAHNRAVGGARASRHLVGDAVDIPSGLVRSDDALAVGFRGIGVCRGWAVHLDCRPSAHPVIFTDC